MTALNVTLYSQPGCGPCVALKRLLTSEGVLFEEVNVRADAGGRDLLASLGYTGTPVLVVRGGDVTRHYGGYSQAVRDAVKELANADR